MKPQSIDIFLSRVGDVAKAYQKETGDNLSPTDVVDLARFLRTRAVRVVETSPEDWIKGIPRFPYREVLDALDDNLNADMYDASSAVARTMVASGSNTPFCESRLEEAMKTEL
jgi:hypothetical protein